MGDTGLVLYARQVRWTMTALYAAMHAVAFAVAQLVAEIDNQDDAPAAGSALAHQVDEAIGTLDAAYDNLAGILRPEVPSSESNLEGQ